MGFELGSLGSHSDPLAPSFTVFMYTLYVTQRTTYCHDRFDRSPLYGSLFIKQFEICYLNTGVYKYSQNAIAMYEQQLIS